MTEMMHAVGYRKPAPISDLASLEDAEVPVPEPGPRDLLIQVKAVSVNPVDVKLRASADPDGELKILGYDAAGVVTAAGGRVTLFAPGDEVYYAGSSPGQAPTRSSIWLTSGSWDTSRARCRSRKPLPCR